MSKIQDAIKTASNAAQGKIERKGKIGGQKTKGSINTKGVVELGIDFKVGGLGVTSDYGGGIKVSIAGQSITWGRRGGKIHYNVGGFELIVEARNCVVTETKKIMGMVVASHTYPDPGCKLPEPPKPPEPPEPPEEEDGTQKLNGIERAIVTISGLISSYDFEEYNTNGYNRIMTNKVTKTVPTVKDIETALLDPLKSTNYSFLFDAKITGYDKRLGDYFHNFQNFYPNGRSVSLSNPPSPNILGYQAEASVWTRLNDEYSSEAAKDIGASGPVHYVLIDSQASIKSYIKNFNSRTSNTLETVQNFTYSDGGYYNKVLRETKRLKVEKVYPLKSQPPKTSQPFLQPGVPPNMNDDCCEEILEALDDLKEVLGAEQILLTKGRNKGRLVEKFVEKPKRDKLIDKKFTNYFEVADGILSELQNFEKILHADFFQEKKFPVPTSLLIPGAEDGVTEATSYYHLVKHLFQSLAHGTIINPLIKIQDTDAAKEGDQTLESQYLSATGWAEAVTKMLYEIVDDGNVGTNMDIRTGVTVTQLLVAVADLSYKIDCIIDCIGVTTKRAKGEVETSYNLVLDQDEKIKGFDPKKANKPLDLNDDMSTEKLLSSLLKTRKNPIVKEEIHPKASSLVELIEGLKNKQ